MDIRRRNLMGQTPITANITIENIKGSWGESSTTISGYRIYESKGSHHVGNGYDLAKVTFSGYPNFTFLYGSYAESSYDYMKISPLDYSSAQNWTGSSSSGHLLSTSGKQSSDAPNLSYTFTNDGGEHFFYILYRKDGNVNSGTDRGYIGFKESNYLEIDESNISITHHQQIFTCNIISDMNWSINNENSWVSTDVISGFGNHQLQISFDLNQSLEQRTGSIQIIAGNHIRSISIIQTPYDFEVPSQISIQQGQVKEILIWAELDIYVECNSTYISYEIEDSPPYKKLAITALSEITETVVITLTSGGISKQILISGAPEYSLFVSLCNEDFTLNDYDNSTTISPTHQTYLESNSEGTRFNRNKGHGIIYKNISNDILSLSFEYYADSSKTGSLSNSWGGILQLCNPNVNKGQYNYLVANKYPSNGFRVEAVHLDSHTNFQVDSTINASRGTWHKVCISTDWDPTLKGTSNSFVVKYYADGSFIGSCNGYYNQFTYPNITLIIGNSWRLLVNGSTSTDINPFCGTIRNVKMWRRALADAECLTESVIQE